MVATYGIAKISEGTDYEEHNGEQMSLLFGNRIAFAKGDVQGIAAAMRFHRQHRQSSGPRVPLQSATPCDEQM